MSGLSSIATMRTPSTACEVCWEAGVSPRRAACTSGHISAGMKVQLAAICDAVKSTVPKEMWGEITEKLDEAEQHREALDVGEDSFDDADDDPYDPTEFIDDDDEF